MKKIALFLFIAMSLCANAQKSFLTIYARDLNATGQTLNISGKLPAGVKSFYAYYEGITLAKLMTTLAEDGYIFEQMMTTSPTLPSGSSNDNYVSGAVLVLMSKGSQPLPPGAVESINSGDDVVEVARYNLQGQPISENEPGLQIIVYSNYTSKVIIKQ